LPHKASGEDGFSPGKHPRAAAPERSDPFPRGEGAPVRTLGRKRNGETLRVGGSLERCKDLRSPPEFLFSQNSVPKCRILPASPRGKQYALPRRSNGPIHGGVPMGAPEGSGVRLRGQYRGSREPVRLRRKKVLDKRTHIVLNKHNIS